jgi:flagellar motor component MotA
MSDASSYTTENRYPALRVISVVFKVIAVLAAVFGLIGAVVGLVQMTGETYGATATGGFMALFSLVYGGLLCIYMFAAAEAIRVFIDIEGNSRLTNDLLRKLLEKQV